jgi:hypothetical protein
LSYYCRDAIGLASYHAARTGTVGALSKYVGQNQAVLYVDELDRKFKADERNLGPTPDANRCYERKADAMHQIQVEQARLELAD